MTVPTLLCEASVLCLHFARMKSEMQLGVPLLRVLVWVLARELHCFVALTCKVTWSSPLCFLLRRPDQQFLCGTAWSPHESSRTFLFCSTMACCSDFEVGFHPLLPAEQDDDPLDPLFHVPLCDLRSAQLYSSYLIRPPSYGLHFCSSSFPYLSFFLQLSSWSQLTVSALSGWLTWAYLALLGSFRVKSAWQGLRVDPFPLPLPLRSFQPNRIRI